MNFNINTDGLLKAYETYRGRESHETEDAILEAWEKVLTPELNELAERAGKMPPPPGKEFEIIVDDFVFDAEKGEWDYNVYIATRDVQ